MRRVVLLILSLVMHLAIYAEPITIDLSSGSYTGNFAQGQSYTFSGVTVNSEWYIAPDFFTPSINGNFVFRPTSGVYKVIADATNKALLVEKIWDGGEGDNYRTYREEYNPTTNPRGGAIWVVGAYGSIGMPKYTSGNAWDTSNVPNMFCVPRIADNIFEWTVTVGQELNANLVDFKFRGKHDTWKEKAFNGTGSGGYKITTTSDIFGIGTGTGEGGNGHNDGNIFLKTGQTLTAGDTYKFRLDCSDAYNIVLTVQKVTVPVSPSPAQSAKQVLSVFSDEYTNQAGSQSIKYKQDNDDWHVISERSFATDSENKYYDIELNNGWVIMKNATTKDVSKYDYMHIDVYRQYFGAGDNTFYAYPRDNNDKPADGDAEGFTAFQNQQVNATEGQWVSVNVPLHDKNSTFKGYMEQMEQLLITQAGKGILAVDNIYFWRELTTATLTSTEGTTVYQHINVPLSATFADKDGDPIAISDMDQITYSKVSGVGSVDASTGVFTSDETGTAVVKVTGVLGTETVEATLTLTVQKIPESTDPTKPGADVHAPYSDSYIKRLYFLDGNVWKDGDNATKHTFDDDSHNHFAIFNNFNHFVTVDLGGNLDVTGFTHLHVDVLQLTGDTGKNLYINPQQGEKAPADTRDDNTKLACEKGVWKSFDIDLSEASFNTYTSFKQIAFLSENGSTADESFAIDNVYFWRDQPADPVTTDTDKKGINWDSTNGTTCYFDRIIWERCNSTTTKKGLDGFAKAHDGDNLTYHTITPEELVSPNQHAQLLLMLTKSIRVSDVELIWANGFPKTYKVYAFEQFPLIDDAVPAALLTNDNLLFEINNKILTTDPSFETQSNLQTKVTHDAQYILIDMTARGEKSTFGYYLAEAHVGAVDDNYNTPDHLGIPDYEILTDVDQTLDVTVRNKRNAILEGVTYRQGSVTTTLTSPQLKKRNNQETVLYATSPGEYSVQINGELSNGTPLNQGTGTITADRRWVNSLVQQVYDKYKDNTEKLNEMFQASRTEGSYSPYKVGDGKEAAQDIYSRWSSFNNTDGTGPIPWDGTTEAANRRKEWNKNQYLLINLEKVYELTNIELIWERAYSPEYKVYGFETENLPTDEQLSQDYATFSTNYESKLLFTGTNSSATIKMYPLHDEHSNLTSGTGAITRDNRTQYLVIKMNEPAQQSGDYFGFSLWEVYADGSDLTITDNVSTLDAPNISVKAGREGALSVTAKGTYEGSDIEEEDWHPVTFSTSEQGYAIFSYHYTDTETGTTLERFYMYKEDSSFDVTDENSKPEEIPAQFLVAIITDNNNGTYGIVASKHGYGQAQGQYDNGVTDGSSNDISFTIQMTSTNTKGTQITGQFELVIYKNAMALLSSSTTKNQVYDDGYFDLDVLKSNSSRETNTIDLRNVDFSYDNNDNPLSAATIPAPHTVKSDGGTQLNPNTIYYTDETGLNAGGNLAVKQNDGSWRVAMLRIFDGWDWAPLTNEGGLVANNASFYTSIPANHYSFFTMPFVPTYDSVNLKEVKLFKPSIYRPERNAVKLDEMTSDDFGSGFEGRPFVIYTENESLHKGNGYAVAFTSGGEVSVPYNTVNWENNGATFIPTYTKLTLEASDADYDYYMYSISKDQFLKVGSSDLSKDSWNGGAGSATEVRPFYAYMKLPKNSVSNEAPAMRFVLDDEPETTGIDTAQTADDEQVKVYDVQGRYVGDSSRNLNTGIYIIKKADGSTRKVYIKK